MLPTDLPTTSRPTRSSDHAPRSAIATLITALAFPVVVALASPAHATTAGTTSKSASVPRSPSSTLQRPDIVILLRHANAPGVGDPAGFRPDECQTQRNLDSTGQQQARQLGATWRARGFQPRVIWSSAWCRCQETARLLGIGPVTILPELNSFFGDGDARERQTAALRRYLQTLDPSAGPYLMVTHQVNISALSGEGVASGDGVLVELQGGGRPLRMRSLAENEK